MRKANAVCGLVMLVFGTAVAVEAQRINDPGADVIGPGAFPFVLGLIIAACGVALCVMAVRASRSPEEKLPGARWLVLGASLALLVAYTHSLAWLGFLAATALFIAVCLALLGERGVVRLAVAGVLASLVIFVIFGLVLGVDLPKGRLFAS
jgi:putative tricarboxylic transport membrane protein